LADEDGALVGTLAVGGSMTSGNSETLNANASLGGVLETQVRELRLGVEGSYGESQVETTADGVTKREDETTTQNAKAFACYKRKFGETYAYSDNSIRHDDLAALDYRLVVGVGGGRHVVSTETSKLGLELGGAYVREEMADDTADDYLAFRVAGRHEQKVGESSKLWESAEYLPRWDDFDDYLINAEAGVEAALNARLDLRLVVQDRYDSKPPEGIDKNDVAVIGSLVCRL